MEIKKIGDTSIRITSKHASILAFPSSKSISSEIDIVLGTVEGGKLAVASPGEYESHEAWIMAINSDVNEPTNNVYVISVDGINICILGEKVQSLTKGQIDEIGLIDIMCIKAGDNDAKVLSSLIPEIDPQVLIPVGFADDDLTKLADDLGVKDMVEDKKYKPKMEDFHKEEYQLAIIKL